MYDHKAVIGGELEDGEQRLWSAQPRQGFLLHPSDAFMIPFSLIWGGFSIIWEYQVLVSDAPLLMALIGLPFVAIGLYLIAGRFYYDAKLREKTFYGITDRRIIILSGIRKKQAHYLAIGEIENLQKFENRDGSGSIVLGFEAITTAYQSQMPIPGQMESTPRMNNLADVHTPFGIIDRLRRTTSRADSSA
ncbi:PH domain-containing protein [Mariprofundus ferrinatatus]|uniref:PH domain-containing protein n=1 Tax=Mariprofundus ferrinatatus TaxID=1921087 RepID=A0A2K8L6M9_9PROT|nr:PH domain-containing protein [Mariprofundus ferrinatatus]ATX82985.1 PH domain-containing protein [Mariprofundus ferrinatatus]